MPTIQKGGHCVRSLQLQASRQEGSTEQGQRVTEAGRCALWWGLMPRRARGLEGGPRDPGMQGASGDNQGLSSCAALVPAQAMANSRWSLRSFLPLCLSRWHQL